MSTLTETLKAIRDDKLTLPQLEAFHEQMTHFKTDLAMQISTLKKARALYLVKDADKTAIERKMSWDASTEGQRLIELEGYMRGVPSELDSLKNRIYAAIR